MVWGGFEALSGNVWGEMVFVKKKKFDGRRYEKVSYSASSFLKRSGNWLGRFRGSIWKSMGDNVRENSFSWIFRWEKVFLRYLG